MKKTLLFLSLVLALTLGARGDEEMRTVQAELKTLGFYYGEVDGKLSADTSAAIKRYQIRNGLEVTGTLTKETSEALGLGGAAPSTARPPASRTPEASSQPQPQAKPPVHLRRQETVQESDRNFLDREETPAAPRAPSDRSIIRPPVPLDPPPIPGEEFAGIFSRTPFATAPREVQEQTVRQAQTILARDGYYRETIDGAPGPATEEALLTYQRRYRLPLTGRLDLQTLSQMRLLPVRRSVGATQPFRGERQPTEQRPLRGVWVD